MKGSEYKPVCRGSLRGEQIWLNVLTVAMKESSSSTKPGNSDSTMLRGWSAQSAEEYSTTTTALAQEAKTSEYVIRVKPRTTPQEETCRRNTKPNTTNLKTTQINLNPLTYTTPKPLQQATTALQPYQESIYCFIHENFTEISKRVIKNIASQYF
jgi:hypothetical protein